jgi:hypothetical protein
VGDGEAQRVEVELLELGHGHPHVDSATIGGADAQPDLPRTEPLVGRQIVGGSSVNIGMVRTAPVPD